MKTILCHIQDDESVGSRLEAALALADATSAHLTCLHVTPVEAYVAFDSFGGVFVMNDVIRTLDEQEAELRARLEANLQNETVVWDYIHVTGSLPFSIITQAALADLIVTGRDPHTSRSTRSSRALIGELIQRTRTPLYIPAPSGPPPDPSSPAVVAWNGSFEAANAVRASVDLLKLAREVHVVTVEEKQDLFPNTRVLEYLSRNEIHAELHVVPLERGRIGPVETTDVGQSILEAASELRAGSIVMGGYSHHRVGEFIFGGVTRSFLESCPLPLVIAH
jgi:nucleotide-binding universal stress UspA family protein